MCISLCEYLESIKLLKKLMNVFRVVFVVFFNSLYAGCSSIKESSILYIKYLRLCSSSAKIFFVAGEMPTFDLLSRINGQNFYRQNSILVCFFFVCCKLYLFCLIKYLSLPFQIVQKNYINVNLEADIVTLFYIQNKPLKMFTQQKRNERLSFLKN